MAYEASRSAVEAQAGATMLLTGYVTSALFLVAASILWTGLLIAPAVQDRMIVIFTLGHAALFYVWGFYGLRKSNKALKTALARKESAGDQA